MSKPSDIIIIGAGLVGLSVADSLLRRGVRVRLFEAKGGPGEGAGQYNSAMVHPSQSLPWQIPDLGIDFTPDVRMQAGRQVQALATSSAYLLRATMARLGLAASYHETGTVQIFDSPAQLERAAKDYSALGAAYVRAVDDSLGAARPALCFAGDSFADPWVYSRALAADIIRRGGQIFYNSSVHITRFRGAAAVKIGNDIIKGEAIILAAGAASAALASGAGLELPITPVIGHALDISWPKDMRRPQRPIMHGPSRSALTPFGEFARLSGTVGLASPDDLLAVWDGLLPGLAARTGTPRLRWSAPRPVCALGRPILCRAPKSGLWLACGHGHMGWTLCAGSGEIMADQITNTAAYPEFGFGTPA